MTAADKDITVLLGRWQHGEPDAEKRLMEAVYPLIRQIARRHLSAESPGMTLQVTDLVNETYLKINGQSHLTWQNRGHFLAIVSTVVRRIIVDHAKSKRRLKRGGDAVTVSLQDLNDSDAPSSVLQFDILALDEALTELGEAAPVAADVVKLRYFAGLSIQEVSNVLDRSVSSVTRDWQFSRAWLHQRLSQ